MKLNLFGKLRAYKQARDNRNYWCGGALVVRHSEGYSAIPGAYLTDGSYTGSRTVVAAFPRD